MTSVMDAIQIATQEFPDIIDDYTKIYYKN